ncbi:MAG: AraC family transcriptional regulator [Bacteroidota bacterium]
MSTLSFNLIFALELRQNHTEMTFYQEKLSQIKKTCYANDKQIEGIIATRRFIDTHFDQDLKLDFLAHKRFTSKFHLQRLFKRYYGLTPKQYMTDKRIAKAKEHLSAGLSVTETCFAVGFESLGSFSQLFKTKTGKSPSEFQKTQVSRSNLDSGV